MNTSIFERSLDTPTEVRTTSRTKHSALEDVLIVGGMSLKGQDNEHIISCNDSLSRNQLLMATSRSNVDRQVCVRYQVKHKGSYSLEIETKGIAATKSFG